MTIYSQQYFNRKILFYYYVHYTRCSQRNLFEILLNDTEIERPFVSKSKSKSKVLLHCYVIITIFQQIVIVYYQTEGRLVPNPNIHNNISAESHCFTCIYTHCTQRNVLLYTHCTQRNVLLYTHCTQRNVFEIL